LLDRVRPTYPACLTLKLLQGVYFGQADSKASKRMNDCGCHVEKVQSGAQRKAVQIALILNATMFVVGMTAGYFARSSGLLADALDMLSDSFGYALALLAIGRSAAFKRGAASWTGIILLVMGASVIADAVRRALGGEEPLGWIMIASALASLVVNVTVLRLLSPFREGEVHMRASWICTRTDVVANIGIIVAAVLVMVTQSNLADVIAGLAIGVYVLKEALEILRQSRQEAAAARG
jgi:Co/Zn/Cd efflux system component